MHHSVAPQFGESIKSVNHTWGVQPCLESYREKNVQVEVLEEGNSWTTNKQRTKNNQQKEGNPLLPKVNNRNLRG